MHFKTSVLRMEQVLCAFVMLLAIPATSGRAQGNEGNPGVAPPDSAPYGATYAEWTARWWQWGLAIPFSESPLFDTTGANAGVGQSGPVWFLAGTAHGGTVRTFSVPAGKSLLFPITTFENDYPCLDDPSFQPAPGQSLFDFLAEGAHAVIDLVTALDATVDGAPLQNLFSYRFTSPLFMFAGDPSLAAVLDPCITGTPQPAVQDGYWIMLRPLPVGTHVLQFHRTYTFPDGSTNDRSVTDIITVVPAPG